MKPKREYYKIKRELIVNIVEVLGHHLFSESGEYNNDDVWDAKEDLEKEVDKQDALNQTTPETFYNEMQQIRDSSGESPCSAHEDMDNTMCHVLEELGYGEGVKIFKEQERWYS